MRALKLPRRFSAPSSGAAQLEMIHQPLYSSAALDNAVLPAEVLFFNYARGGTVSGAGGGAIAANDFHTNMETPNVLAAPKTFTISGIRVVILPLAFNASPAESLDSADISTADEPWNDFLLAWETAAFTLSVGPKTYVEGPLFLLPSNGGVEGIADVSNSSTAAAAVGIRMTAPFGVGRSFDLDTYPILLANQQSFSAKLAWRFTTAPTMVDERLVQVILDGIMGREVA